MALKSAEGFMEKTLVTCIAALLCYGCERSSTISEPHDIPPLTQAPVVLIDGFGEKAPMLTSSTIIRVGTYYNFLPYDSLRVSFSATRLATELPFDEILVKIGPATYLRDSVYATQENVSLVVRVSDISKPVFCALTFRTNDPQTVLRLTDLRVIGWMSK